MNILYYGFRGAASLPVLGWTVIGIGIALFVIGCVAFIYNVIDGKELIASAVGAIFAIVIGIIAKADTRVPIVKATVDNEIPWVEVAKDYKYLDSEGDICIFEVLNTSVKDWELKVNGQNK